MKTSSSCELTPRVPSPPPCQLPPGPWTSLASSALCLDCLHANPSTTSVDQSAEAFPYPTTVRLSGCRLRPTSSKGAAKRRVKSGNFNRSYRQFYYALNNLAPFGGDQTLSVEKHIPGSTGSFIMRLTRGKLSLREHVQCCFLSAILRYIRFASASNLTDLMGRGGMKWYQGYVHGGSKSSNIS